MKWLRADYPEEGLKEAYTEDQITVLKKIEEIEDMLGIQEPEAEELPELKLNFEAHVLKELEELQKALQSQFK